MALLIRWQHYVCVCLLLLAVVLPPASMAVADGECYWTAMHVPRWCRAEFIRALWNNNHHGIRPKCCILLTCVRDDACFHVLKDFCDVWRYTNYCKWLPPLRTSNSSKPAPPPGRHHH